MGMTLKQGGFKDGERALDMTDAVSNPYFGGQPAMAGANGVKLCKVANRANFIGLFAVSSYEDLQNGNTTVVGGGGLVKLTNGSVSQDSTTPTGAVVEGAPYNTAVTFAPGQGVYIEAGGLLTNTGIAGQAIGVVVKGQGTNDDSVEFYMFPVNNA